MALILKDRVKETSTGTGTGAITLAGTSTGYQAFSVIGNANTTYYCIAGQGTGEWEVGIGTYTLSGTTLSRDTILASSNSGSIVTLSPGIKDVFVVYPAERSVNYNQAGTGVDITGTVDVTNLEVTNIKAKDGTASATIADSTGIMTIGSSVLTTTDINGGTIDGTAIGGTTPAAGAFTTLSATGVIKTTAAYMMIHSTNPFFTFSQDGVATPAYLQQISASKDLNIVEAETGGKITFWADGLNKRAEINSTGIAVTGSVTVTRAAGDIGIFTTGSRSAYISLDSQGFGLFTGAAQTGTGLYVNAVAGTVSVTGALSATVADNALTITAAGATSDLQLYGYNTAVGGAVIEARRGGTYKTLTLGGTSVTIGSTGAGTMTLSSTGLAVTGAISASSYGNSFGGSFTAIGSEVIRLKQLSELNSWYGFAIQRQATDATLGIGYSSGSGTWEFAASYASGGAFHPMSWIVYGAEAMRLSSTGLAVTGVIEGAEQTAPAAPAANGYRIYAEDNGAGKTRLMVKFATGAAQQLALEP
jgi:hypothetical protein